MPGQFNSFQKTMLQWNEMHAYNGVHVVRIAGDLDVPRLTNAVNGLLEQEGLTNLTLDHKRGTFHYAGGGARLIINVLAGSRGAPADLEAESERQLNSAFKPFEIFSPFRFFVWPEEGSFLLGLVYFHAIADAESVVLLLKDLVHAYSGAGAGERPEPMELYPSRHDNLLLRHPQVLAKRLVGLPAHARMLRSSFRARYQDAGNMSNGLRFFGIGREELRSLILTGKDWRVTVNDLLLALLMKALAPLASDRRKASRRKMLSVGCIVNSRKDLGVDSQRTFGLFLGSFMVTHDVPDGISLNQLAGDLRDQTLAIKQHRLYLGAPLELSFGRLMFSFFSPEGRKKFYQKNYPLWGGITNMNLNSIWPMDEDATAKDYFRAVSTGPVTPLVLAATTVGDHANIGLTYRTTVFTAAIIEQFICSFLEALKNLSGGA
jgi:NRPS condensation-like uncharacterized protein